MPRLRLRGARWPDRTEWINDLLLGSLLLGVGYRLTAVEWLAAGLVTASIVPMLKGRG